MDDIFNQLGDVPQPPLDGDVFREEIVKRYAETATSIGIEACVGAAVDNIWPVVTDRSDPNPTIQPRSAVDEAAVAPTVDSDGYDWWPAYREYQRDAVVSILTELYVEDKSVVTLSAPTGAGKSLILHAAMAVVAEEFGRNSFFTTPLNSLIDQVDTDGFIGEDVLTIKGKNNYTCVHPQDRGTPVDSAVCQRVDDFECQYKDRHHENGGCPYYGRKKTGKSHPELVTNLSYLMANSMIPETVDSKFDPRELLVIDECQSIEDFGLGFVSVNVSNRSVPIDWDGVELPPQTEDTEQLADWLEVEVLPRVQSELDALELKVELTESESDNREELQQFERKCQNLIRDVQSNHWVANRDIDGSDWSVEFEPITIGRFLDSYLWSQGQKVVLSSATIPKGGFLEEIGLDDRQVGRVEVESTFPTERRPVYTDNPVGKMTMRQRDQTIPKMGRRIGALADHYWDEGNFRGFVHCHSYKIAERLYDALPADVRKRTRVQDSDDREGSLDAWLDAPVDEVGFGDSDGGQLFLSVAMDEGISLDDWRARWQVVAKAAYPYMGPEAKRANYRMDELDDWTWYAGKAAINLQQAVGRGMRSQDDWCHTYVLDKSACTLIDRNEYLLEGWFKSAVNEDTSGDLPERF